MKNYFLIVLALSLSLTGCSKPGSQLTGLWKNSKGIFTIPGDITDPAHWKAVEFVPSGQAVVTCSGKDSPLDFKIVDEGRINVAGQLYQYSFNEDTLTITAAGTTATFLKTTKEQYANDLVAEKYQEGARQATEQRDAAIKALGR